MNRIGRGGAVRVVGSACLALAAAACRESPEAAERALAVARAAATVDASPDAGSGFAGQGGQAGSSAADVDGGCDPTGPGDDCDAGVDTGDGEPNAVPAIVSDPVTAAALGAPYRYDVDAEDLDEHEVLTYELVGQPADMTIDAATGLITWQPSMLGVYAVTVQVTDGAGQSDAQTFDLQVVADDAAPAIELTTSVETMAPGATLLVSVAAQDEFAVASLVVTVDGVPVALDGSGQYAFSSDLPGIHVIVVTAGDGSGNVASATALVGVHDAADAEPPLLALDSPGEDDELTYVHEVVGMATDANLMGYELALRRIEPGAVFRPIGAGLFDVIGGALGTLDTTLLPNGYYELRVSARDVNGLHSELVRPVRVDGQAKLGSVQLDFVDMALPMAGVPLSVVRSYDSIASRSGAFGRNWSLDVEQGSAQHNRPVGEGLLIFTPDGEPVVPCHAMYEQKSHYTEVRLSAREHYLFRPLVFDTELVDGACEGEVLYELVEGTTAGAELFIVGGPAETRVRAPELPPLSHPELLPPADLTYALQPERGIFDPHELRLSLRDGRKFDLRVGDGIVRIEDRNGNVVSVASDGLHHSAGRSLIFERDLAGRITRISDPTGRSVQYAYDAGGDLIAVTDALERSTHFAYGQGSARSLERIVGPGGDLLATMDYDAGGRLTAMCDGDGGCSERSYDLAARTLTETDASGRTVGHEYDVHGNLVAQTDALGHTSSFEYDADDNLIRAEAPDGSVETFARDSSHNLLTRVLPHEPDEAAADFTYTYTYNARGDRERVTLPGGGVIAYEYDAAGNVAAVKDGAGTVIESRIHHEDGTLASMTDRFGTVTYGAYDATGQPIAMTDSFGQAISYDYDDGGRVLSRSERGQTISYDYDALGRPTLVDYGPRTDSTGAGGICPGDLDCDGVEDGADNCASIANTEQQDGDANAWNAPGAVSVWRFDEPSGTTFADSAGTHDAQAINGASRTAGKHGQALSLDGVNDYAFIADAADLRPTQTLTVQAWVYPVRDDAVEIAVEKGDANFAGYGLYVCPGAQPLYLMRVSGGMQGGGSTAPLSLHEWHHLALTFDASQPDQTHFYVDGVEVAQTATSCSPRFDAPGTLVQDTSPLLIGTRRALRYYMAGRVDEVAVHGRVLSAAELQQHYQRGLYGDGLGDACDACAADAQASCSPATCMDADGDGYGLAGASACGHDAAAIDCDDADPAVHPAAEDTCDGVDNDCNGLADRGCGPHVTLRYEYADVRDARWTAVEGPTLGRVERSFTPGGRLHGWREPNGDQFTRVYDPSGRVAETIDPLGNRTLYGYDAAGRLATITDAALNATTTFERDAAGRVTSTIDPLQHETATAYRLGGRLRSTTNARGFTTRFDHGSLTSSITDALDRTTVTAVTELGLPASTTYPGGATTSSSYLGTTRLDESQRFATSRQDELGRERSFGYDERSGLRTATDLAGQAWSYTYAPSQGAAIDVDVESGEVRLGHHDGAASSYRFSSGGSGSEYLDVSALVSDPALAEGGFAQHLRSVTSPLGQATQLIRGSSGRVERVVYPDGGEKVISYGSDAQPVLIALPHGTVLGFEHDAAMREVSRTSTLGEQRTFTYGPGDRVESMTDDTGTTTYEYDGGGRPTGLTYPHGGSVRYDRDLLGRVTAVRVQATATAAESVTAYGYDENGNLETITDPLGGATELVYDEVDRLIERTLPNGVTTTYGYDDRDRVLSIVHRGPSGDVLASVVYERSPSGEPTRIMREDGSHVVLTYDAALRLDTETHVAATGEVIDSSDYDHDADGNRTARTSPGGFETYAYEAGFRLTGITGSAGDESYGYDRSGRNTTIVRAGAVTMLEYDSDDAVTRVVRDGSEVVSYAYDGVGRRVSRREAGATTRWLVAPSPDGAMPPIDVPHAVTDDSGNVLASYVFAGDQPIARIAADGTVIYYLHDALGSVIGIADGSGASVASIAYDAFGNVTRSSGSAAAIPPGLGMDFRHRGMLRDAAIGLDHAAARTYDARTGRFTSRDPAIGAIAPAASVDRPESYHPYRFAEVRPPARVSTSIHR